MKIIFLILIIVSLFASCKKETSKPNATSTNSNTNTSNYNDTTNKVVAISSCLCDSVKISGSLAKDQLTNNVTATITYVGGNGKTYLESTYNTIDSSDLKATLKAGTLENGKGELTFYISGTPSKSGYVSFEINFGGQKCLIKLKINEGLPGPIITDLDGNTYKTVIIGTQHWMAENLKVSKYNDGTSIPNIVNKSEYAVFQKAAWSYYDNNPVNNTKYGKLYNYWAISPYWNGNKNVCPSG